jgi:hypothetical protein
MKYLVDNQKIREIRQRSVCIYSHTMCAVFTSYKNQEYHFVTKKHIE